MLLSQTPSWHGLLAHRQNGGARGSWIKARLLQPRRAISSEEPPPLPEGAQSVDWGGSSAGGGEVTRLVVHKKVERMKSKTYGELKSYLCMPAAFQVSSSLGGGWGGVRGSMGVLVSHEGGIPVQMWSCYSKETGGWDFSP